MRNKNSLLFGLEGISKVVIYHNSNLMTGIETSLISSEAIKTAAEKSEGLIKSLFGKAFDEAGEMIRDQVRLRRFKNQIKIFEKAQKFLKDGKIDPGKVSLKVLAPLIEFSSYEEDESLQDRWAKLIKNILIKPGSVMIQQNAIALLNKISNDEAIILDSIFDKMNEKRIASAESYNQNRYGKKTPKMPSDFNVEGYSFKISKIQEDLESPYKDIKMQISNLVALGALRYEIEVSGKGEKTSPDDSEVDLDLDVYDSDRIRLTLLGHAFLELCRA